MNKTSTQLIIENSVTNGLEYNTSTIFLEEKNNIGWVERKIREYLVREEDVKNTQDGLRAHLFELTYGHRVSEHQMQDYLKHLKKLKSLAIYSAGIEALKKFRFNGRVLKEKIGGFLVTQYSR